MNLTHEQEQQSDLMWALKVLNGKGDTHDSAQHARWLLTQLADHANSKVIRKVATKCLHHTAATT